MWELQIEVRTEDQPEAEAWAWGLGVSGLCIDDADTGRSDGSSVLRVWLASDADRESFTSDLADVLPGAVLRWRVAPAPEASAPRLVGSRFAVVDMDQEVPAGRIALRVRGGLAFGDGHHPSSALCLGALEELALAGPLPACLDVGTGTGLLCLAAAALGSPRLGAVDIDSLALRAASEAFDRAGLRVELSAELPDQPWPLVLANLHRAAILAVIDPLSRAVAPGGHLLLSGFVQGAEEELSRQLGMKGLVVRRRWRDQGWVALLLGRPAAEGPTMEISLERLSPEEHRLALRRASGPEERVTLNTRSFLLHDLVHYSVEAEADLREAFWGSLAAGRSLEELGVQARQAWPEGSELAWAEGVVGPLQGALRRGQPAEELYRELERRAEDAGEVLPPFLDRPMLERAAQRCQQLLDRWSRLGIGGFIRLPWPVPRS